MAVPNMTHLRHNPTARVFFALWPTAGERAQLAAWQAPLKKLCGGRAMRDTTLHSTLVFIGDIESPALEALQLAAREVSAETFELCFDHAGYWGHNHIVYAAPSQISPPLVQLVETLEQRLDAHRFKFVRRAYQPHVTLLRNARWRDTPLPAMQPASWQVRDFALVHSALRDGLADYRVLVRFPLRVAGG